MNVRRRKQKVRSDRRPPQMTPGKAYIERLLNDDFTLPASLYYDSVFFYSQAVEAQASKDIYGTDRYLRAAVYAAFAFLEADLNQAAFGHAQAHGLVLEPITRDILEEKETRIDDKGYIVRATKYYPLDVRFSFIAQFLSGKEFDRSTELWSRFQEARRIRDVWTHPKPPFDTWSLDLSAGEKVMRTVRDIWVELSRMMELDPPPWMVPFEVALSSVKKKSGSGL